MKKSIYILFFVCFIVSVACLGEFIDWRAAEYHRQYKETEPNEFADDFSFYFDANALGEIIHLRWKDGIEHGEIEVYDPNEKRTLNSIRITPNESCPAHNEDEINKATQTDKPKKDPNQSTEIIMDGFEPISLMIYFGDNKEIKLNVKGDELLIIGDTEDMNEAAKIFFNELLKPMVDAYIKQKLER